MNSDLEEKLQKIKDRKNPDDIPALCGAISGEIENQDRWFGAYSEEIERNGGKPEDVVMLVDMLIAERERRLARHQQFLDAAGTPDDGGEQEQEDDDAMEEALPEVEDDDAAE